MSFFHSLEQAGLITICFLLAVYFLPAIVAKMRHKPNAGAIFALNLCLGWTLLGWAGALVWACMAEAPLETPTTPEHITERKEIW